jgi:hypothetical protein
MVGARTGLRKQFNDLPNGRGLDSSGRSRITRMGWGCRTQLGANLARQAMSLETHFRPLRPAPRRKLIAAIVVGPCLWIIALALMAVSLHRTDAIEIALLIAGASFAVAFLVLVVLRGARRREERRYAAGR